MGKAGGAPHILVVDDDVFITDLLVEDLTSRGYRVSVAGNARMVGRLMELGRPDLILLDLTLPGMDGTEIGHLLGSDAATATIPIVVVSGDRRVAGKAKRVGARAWFAKPFEIESLAETIRALLDPGEGGLSES